MPGYWASSWSISNCIGFSNLTNLVPTVSVLVTAWLKWAATVPSRYESTRALFSYDLSSSMSNGSSKLRSFERSPQSNLMP